MSTPIIIRSYPYSLGLGRFFMFRLWSLTFDLRIAWHLPWEKYILKRIPSAHRTKDGWIAYVSIGALHTRFQFHKAHYSHTDKRKLYHREERGGTVLRRVVEENEDLRRKLQEMSKKNNVVEI